MLGIVKDFPQTLQQVTTNNPPFIFIFIFWDRKIKKCRWWWLKTMTENMSPLLIIWDKTYNPTAVQSLGTPKSSTTPCIQSSPTLRENHHTHTHTRTNIILIYYNYVKENKYVHWNFFSKHDNNSITISSSFFPPKNLYNI